MRRAVQQLVPAMRRQMTTAGKKVRPAALGDRRRIPLRTEPCPASCAPDLGTQYAGIHSGQARRTAGSTASARLARARLQAHAACKLGTAMALDALLHQGGGSHAPSKADLQKAHSPTHELPSPVSGASPAATGPASGKQPSGSGRQAAAAVGSSGAKAQPTAATPSAAELAKAASESRVSQGAAAR